MAARRRGPAIYEQIADDWRAQISDGRLAPGQRLGAERDLAHDERVGLWTIRQALAMLRGEGLLAPFKPGQVARVREQVERQPVALPRGAEMVLRMPTPDEVAALDLLPGVPVAAVEFGGKVTLYPGDRYRFTFR